MRSFRYGLGAAAIPVAAIVLVLTAGAAASFPELDDGYLLLMLRESGPSSIAAAHPDRPIAAHAWQLGATALGGRFWPAAFVLHAALWFALGLFAVRLMVQLFPERRRWAAVAGCLTVAPLAVQTQLSTVTISLLGLTSAVLGYAGIELGGAYVQRGRGLALAAACVLLASAVLFSEYGVPVALAGAVLIGAGSGRQTDGSRWRRGAAAFAVTAVAAFAIYHVVGDSSARARVDPLRPVLYPERLADAPLDLLTRAWQVVVGAYGEGASELRVSWDTKSSLIAVAAGCALAATLIGIARPSQTPETPRPEDRKPLVLALAALAFGLAPVALMQAYEPTAFASRFHLPVLPIAAVLTVSLALSMSRPRFQVVAIAVLGLLAGVATVRQAWNGWRRQEMMASIGAGVRPLVRATDGLTVVVLTGEKACPWDYACTAEATARWTAEEGRSVWFSPARELPFDLDRESVCSGSVVLDASVRSIRRTGRVGQVLWVDVRPDGFRLWPYCEPPGRGA